MISRGLRVHSIAPKLSSVQSIINANSETLIAYVCGMFIKLKKNIIEMSLVPMPEMEIGNSVINVIIGANENTYRKLMSMFSAIIAKYICNIPMIHIPIVSRHM